MLLHAWNSVSHLVGRISHRYYFEDFVRVYPHGIVFNRLGFLHRPTKFDLNNYLNHRKVLSLRRPIRERPSCRRYRLRQRIRLRYLESSGRVKEYQKEDLAVAELKRVTRREGTIVVGTPNSELLGEHGFSFDEIDQLMRRHFEHYCIFENALLPYGTSRGSWERRLASGRVGVVVSESIKLAETALADDEIPGVKRGSESGYWKLGQLTIDTRLLHNTHSWVVVAIP